MTEKRTDRRKPCSYRIPKECEALFDDFVAAYGSPSAVLTAGLLALAGKSKTREAERRQLALLLAHAQRIGERLGNEAGDDALSAAEAKEELRQIRTGVMQLLGRRS